VIFPDSIENGETVQREATVALKIESVRVTSPDNIANGKRVTREATVVLKKGMLELPPLITLSMD
jgi:hypothetical protein